MARGLAALLAICAAGSASAAPAQGGARGASRTPGGGLRGGRPRGQKGIPGGRGLAVENANCQDRVPDGQAQWYDSGGPENNCTWYAGGSNCDERGDLNSNFDMTASEACCVCGGGVPTAGDVAVISDGYIVTNNLYVCPAGYEPIPSEAACQSAGDNLGLALTVEGLQDPQAGPDPGDPTHCWAFLNEGSYVRLFWNGNITTTPTVIRPFRNVICQTMSASTTAEEPSPTMSASTTAEAPSPTTVLCPGQPDEQYCDCSGGCGETDRCGCVDAILCCGGATDTPTYSPTPMPPTYPPTPYANCQDRVPDGQAQWYDSGGPEYNCTWYASGSNCNESGDLNSNFNMTANEACCVCGGGAPTAGDVALTSDGYIVTNNLYGCPASYEPIPSQTACQSAGDNLGLDLTVEGLLGDEVDPGDPTGCWAFGSSGSYVRLLWNGNGTMTPTVIRALRNVICQTTSAGTTAEAPTYAPSSPSSPRLRLVVVAVVVALLLLALVVIVVIFYRRKCR